MMGVGGQAEEIAVGAGLVPALIRATTRVAPTGLLSRSQAPPGNA
jgi:hypothetical protein